MCPACAASAALIAAGATSTGGLAAFVLRKLHIQGDSGKLLSRLKSKEERNGYTEREQDGSSENGGKG